MSYVVTDMTNITIANILTNITIADDIVLLAPTARVTRKLLSLCDEYASGFNV